MWLLTVITLALVVVVLRIMTENYLRVVKTLHALQETVYTLRYADTSCDVGRRCLVYDNASQRLAGVATMTLAPLEESLWMHDGEVSCPTFQLLASNDNRLEEEFFNPQQSRSLVTLSTNDASRVTEAFAREVSTYRVYITPQENIEEPCSSRVSLIE